MKSIVLVAAVLLLQLAMSSSSTAQEFEAGTKLTIQYSNGGEITLSVSQVEQLPEIADSNALGIYVIVWIEIENVGREAVQFPYVNWKLIDEQIRTFDAGFELSEALTISETGVSPFENSRLNPGLTSLAAMVFDVPINASGLALLDSENGASLALSEEANPDPTPTRDASVAVVPFEESTDTRYYRIKVGFAQMGLHPLLDFDNDLIVNLSVEVVHDRGIGFGLPEDDFTVTSGDGRVFEFSRPKSGIAHMTIGEEMAVFIPGETYSQTFVFALDSENPIRPADFVLSYWEGGPDGTEYRFEIPLSRASASEPPTTSAGESDHNCLAVLSDVQIWEDLGSAIDNTMRAEETGSFSVVDFELLIDEWAALEEEARTLSQTHNDEPIFVAMTNLAIAVQTYLSDAIETGGTDPLFLDTHRDLFTGVQNEVSEQCDLGGS